MPKTVRALFVAGPLDGRIEIVEDRPTLAAIERSGPPAPRDLEAPEWEAVEMTQVQYRKVPLRDLDGTSIAIYTPDDAMVPADRGRGPEKIPDVTVWGLASALDAARLRIRELEDHVRAADAREAWAVRHVDALAGTLRRVREELAVATSGDD